MSCWLWTLRCLEMIEPRKEYPIHLYQIYVNIDLLLADK